MDDTLRSRIEALNRGPIATAATAVASILPPAEKAAARKQPIQTAGDLCTVGGLVRRGEVVESQYGPHWRIELPLDSLWHGGAKLIAARQEFLQLQRAAAERAVEPTLVIDPQFAKFIAALPDRAIAMDLETCGLAGSALFLAGVLRQRGGVPFVELLLARNYAEEAAVLDSLWQIVAEHDVLLTFNGKTFDWPMVVERSVRHRLQPPVQRERWMHIDILHHARRRWRKRLPNCRLQTLEQHVCRRSREADIPGSQIPAVYANYVRTGFEREMDIVLYHNALDLVTLFDLAHRLAA